MTSEEKTIQGSIAPLGHGDQLVLTRAEIYPFQLKAVLGNMGIYFLYVTYRSICRFLPFHSERLSLRRSVTR
jgi:hypothetical protein